MSALTGDAATMLATLKGRPASPIGASVALGFDVATANGLKPRFAVSDVAAEAAPARITLPGTAAGALHVEDAATSVGIDVSLKGAAAVAAQQASGYVVYSGALGSGGTVVHRAVPAGAEDFVALDAKPATTQVSYDVALGAGAAGLRLVGGTLEVVDSGGAPRLRVAPPYIVGADGATTGATLAVAGCAVDTDPSPPWGRAVTAPGARTCSVTVTWPATGVAYPAILDPRWTTTGSMGTARQEHTALLLSTGKVLVAGGRSSSSGTTGLATAELFDKTSGTWAATGSMTGGRRLHSMTQLPASSNSTTSGRVLVAGGIDGTTSLGTAQLYNPSAGTWAAAGNLNAARHLHTETLLPDGRVLVCGGMNGTTTLQSAAVYNPASGSGSWSATTGPIPPPGWRFGTATLIQTTNSQLNNHVLLVGGNNGTASIAAVFLFDPVQNAFSTLASISSPREQHTASILPSSNGKILVAGGKNGSTVLASALIFDPSASNGTWSAAGTMTSVRFGHSATVLPTSIVANGSVLVTGGNNGSGTLSSAELFSGTSTWTATPSMPSPAQGHTATLLGNNMILVAGGLNGTTVLNGARLYDAAFGLGCSSGSQCPSGNCVNGTCCDTACNGGCGACNLAGHLGTCSPVANTTVCRTAGTGGCDVAESCDGSSLNCPADAFAPSTTVCHPQAGECDVAEKCPGNSAACPADLKKTNGTACTDDGNLCTKDICDGTANTCQHPPGNAGTQCRGPAGACDVAAVCTGTSATCPANGFKSSSTVCRPSAGGCDVAENCTGSSAACPADAFRSSSITCRPSAGACDVAETCTGTSAACPSDQFVPSSAVCRVAGSQCDLAETCTGTSANCPADAVKPNGSSCTDGNACTLSDTCQSGACTSGAPVTCTAQDQCHAAGVCDQSSGACSNPALADGTTCDDGNPSTEVDTCQAATCVGAADPASVNSFETLGRWSFVQNGTVVRLNPNHTQGASSLEVAIQGDDAQLQSVAMGSLSNADENILLDVMFPQQPAGAPASPSIQLCMELRSAGVNLTCFPAVVVTTDVPQGTWQTFHWPVGNDLLTKLGGKYADLRWSLLFHSLNNRHVLIDFLRFIPSVTPHVQGIATDSNGVTKAVFTYTMTGNASTEIPYGQGNFLSDAKAKITAPAEPPPTVFIPVAAPPFVAALVNGTLKWTVQQRSATATTSSTPLPTVTLPDGTIGAVLPDGTKVPIDTDFGPGLSGTIVASDTSYTQGDRSFDIGLVSNGEIPIGPTSAGTLPGTFRVTDDGAAEYVVPLELPHGRNGVEPHLSLLYNSRDGDGILGPGWSVRGLDRITRCKKTFAVANEQGVDPAAVAFTDADELCFNGERLVPLAGSNPKEYRIKRDAFTRFVVTASDSRGPLTFQGFRKDGLIDTFGLDARSRSEPTRTTFTQGSLVNSTVRDQWGLAKRVDRFGNEMDITYRESTGLTPDAIAYTRNPNTGRSPTKTIKFNYQIGAPTRATVPRFVSGVNVSNGAQVIKSIDVFAPNPQTQSLVTTYKLSYETKSISGRAVLTRVQRCDGAGVCMAPTLFTWDPGNYGFRKVASDLGNGHPSDPGTALLLTAGDLNGDGKDDVAYRTLIPPDTSLGAVGDALKQTSVMVRFSNLNGLGPEKDSGIPTLVINPQTHHQELGSSGAVEWFTADTNAAGVPTIVDFNGDGLGDLVVPFVLLSNQTDVTKTILSPSRVDRFQAGARGVFTPLPQGTNPDLSNLSDPSFNIEADEMGFGEMVWADLNGDGQLDFARKLVTNPGSTGKGTVGFRLAQNGALAASYIDTGHTWGGVCRTIGCPDPTELFMADIDGDGRTEMVMSDTDHSVTFGLHAGINGPSTMPTNVPWNLDVRRQIDFNGDGLEDFLQVTTNPPSYQLWMNMGTGFLAKKLYDPTADSEIITAYSVGAIMDLNGDGMEDILVTWCGTGDQSSTPAAYLSDGNGGFVKRDLVFLTNNAQTVQTCAATLLDVDGDGQKDVLQNESFGGANGWKLYFRQPAHLDRMTNVRNGLTAQVGIEYSRYDAAAGDACQSPYACRGRNVEVVSGYTVENGAVKSGQPATTHYSMTYQGVRVDARGNGLLGFDMIERRNDLAGVDYERDFDLVTRIGNWYPFVGLPTGEKTGVRILGQRKFFKTRTTHYLTQQSDSNQFGPYFVAADRVEEIEEEEGVQQRHTVQNLTYDAYGNLHTREILGLVTNTRDFVEYTDIVNDASDKWLLGKIGGVTMTSTSASTAETSSRRTTFSIDDNTGAVLGKTVQPGDAQSELAVTYVRNTDGLVEQIIEQPINDVSRTSKITYDPIEGAWPATYVNPLTQSSRVVYHCGLGVVASSTDVNNVTTSFRYDGFGRPRGQSDATGLSEDQHYARPDSGRGIIVNELDTPTNHARSLTFDVLGREIGMSQTGFDGTNLESVTRTYDALTGQLGTITRPYGAAASGFGPGIWTYTYDEIGRLVVAQPPGESPRKTIYEGLKATDYVGNEKKRYRIDDGMGRIVLSASFDPTDSAPDHEIQTGYDYGPFGLVRHVYQPSGGTVTMSYDPLGRRTQIDDPDAGRRVIHYNAMGQVVREELSGQADLVYVPDVLGRVTSIQQGSSTTTFQWDTALNGVGKLDTETSPSSVSTSYSYLTNGLTQTTVWGVGNDKFQFDWGYDPAGRLQQITYPDTGAENGRFAVTLSYGNDGQMASVASTSTGTVYWQKTAVNDDGQALVEAFSDGLFGLHVTDPTSGKVMRIEAGTGPIVQAEDGSGPTLQSSIQSLGYTYYADGKLQRRDDAFFESTEEFSYDNVDRVTGWKTLNNGRNVTYGYDDAGNLKTRDDVGPAGTFNESYTYGENGAGPHALTTGPLGSYSYDGSGRQTARPGQPDLTYTDFDLPSQITTANEGVITFQYAATGARVAKVTNNVESITVGLYERRNEDGAVTHTCYLPSGHGPVGQIPCDASATPVFFHADRLGTIDMVTQSGIAITRDKRDPFGRAQFPDTAGVPVTLGFIGQTEDKEMGLINLNHRLYDAQIGRFVSPDPLVHDALDGQAYNRYTYAANNPLSFIDPSGLDDEEPPPPIPGGDEGFSSLPSFGDDLGNAEVLVEPWHKNANGVWVQVTWTPPPVEVWDIARPAMVFASLDSADSPFLMASPFVAQAPTTPPLQSQTTAAPAAPQVAGTTGMGGMGNPEQPLDVVGAYHPAVRGEKPVLNQSAYYEMNPQLAAKLQPFFTGTLGIDLSQVHIQFGSKNPFGQAEWDGRTLTINRNLLNQGGAMQVFVIAHELTHLIQMNEGPFTMLWREFTERNLTRFERRDTGALQGMSLSGYDPLNSVGNVESNAMYVGERVSAGLYGSIPSH